MRVLVVQTPTHQVFTYSPGIWKTSVGRRWAPTSYKWSEITTINCRKMAEDHWVSPGLFHFTPSFVE